MLIDIGLTDFEKARQTQRDFVRLRKLGEIDDSILITEHREVFTLGRSGRASNLLVSRDEMSRCGISLVPADRGGDITYHGPGQLVAYPIIDLKNRARDLHKYMRDLETAVIDFTGTYGVQAVRVPGMTGVWSGGAKIASIGIGASDWVTYHGLAVNISCDLRFFEMIRPCGLDGVRITSLEKILKHPVSMDEARSGLIRSLCDIFKIEDHSHEYSASMA